MFFDGVRIYKKLVFSPHNQSIDETMFCSRDSSAGQRKVAFRNVSVCVKHSSLLLECMSKHFLGFPSIDLS